MADIEADPFQPLSATYTPERCRIAPGSNARKTDGQIRAGSARAISCKKVGQQNSKRAKGK